ncbi:unnamed protein product [Effrenium voratum]|uniref:Uncharacterized protein n=1 Tax=Effrenium voratum TaxID=2562239 RepID=A0AA36NLY7_9DINO|nr:unnamed protein product [Effrenium voratum]CAJ1408338.1 unnamed protein product [Effrenium voratum]CAJ1431898.1 unnamed protein product [Effrenium voratum]
MADELRQKGVRPKMPAYDETPLCSVGKLVRVKLASGQLRRAMVECVEEAEGTVDVAFVGSAAKDSSDATVPIDSLRPLEPIELPFLQADNFSVSGAKEAGNAVFKLGDMEAASDLYGRALDALERAAPKANTWVLANRNGALLPGKIVLVDNSNRADVELRKDGRVEVLQGVPHHALIGVQLDQMLLQGSLHLNRSRALAQLGQQQEAAQDLSVTIALWAAYKAAGKPLETEGKEQLVKAYYLRAKTRILRQRPEPARADLRCAWALRPESTAALRQAERELELMEKEKVRSNKQLAKEIAKLADVAMSGLDEEQLASFGGANR